jgi:hypothetical protein
MWTVTASKASNGRLSHGSLMCDKIHVKLIRQYKTTINNTNEPDERVAKEPDAIGQEGQDDDVDRANFAHNHVRDVEERNANDAGKGDGHSYIELEQFEI